LKKIKSSLQLQQSASLSLHISHPHSRTTARKHVADPYQAQPRPPRTSTHNSAGPRTRPPNAGTDSPVPRKSLIRRYTDCPFHRMRVFLMRAVRECVRSKTGYGGKSQRREINGTR